MRGAGYDTPVSTQQWKKSTRVAVGSTTSCSNEGVNPKSTLLEQHTVSLYDSSSIKSSSSSRKRNSNSAEQQIAAILGCHFFCQSTPTLNVCLCAQLLLRLLIVCIGLRTPNFQRKPTAAALLSKYLPIDQQKNKEKEKNNKRKKGKRKEGQRSQL